MTQEFEIISRYFAARGVSRPDTALAMGDDAALLRVLPPELLAVSIDTLVRGVHFPVHTPAADIGYKALAVNLSDMAAMGARPAWATLALTLPEVDEAWLGAFSEGFFSLAQRFDTQLVGGDTTRGPLTVTVQLHGLVDESRVLRRDGARPGDGIFVSGTLGDAGLALWLGQQGGGDIEPYLQARLNRPEPRIALGQALAGVATAAIDVSDGLLADLGHILDSSACGAQVRLAELPLSEPYRRHLGETEADYLFAATAGDDYELCFTVAEPRWPELADLARRCGCPVTRIGRVLETPGLSLVDGQGRQVETATLGYQHFQTQE